MLVALAQLVKIEEAAVRFAELVTYITATVIGGGKPMSEVNIFTVHLNGDIGGAGISRFHMTNAGGTALITADAASVGSALHTFYTALAGILSNNYTFNVDPVFETVNAQTGAIVSLGGVTAGTGTVTAIGSGTHVAGMGARIYWKTSTIRNRRFVRGATFITPLISAAYDTTGAIAGGDTGTIETAAAAMINGLVAGGIIPVVWARPKTAFSGDGAVAPIIAWTVGTTPASLRSRRV